MKLQITKKHGGLVLIASLLLLGMGVIGWWLVGEAALIILPVLSAMLILVVLLEVYSRLSEKLSETYRNQEL